MKDVNEVHIIGRAGKDAETKYTPGGKMLTKFSLATGGGSKKDGSGDWPTDWHSCQVWGEELGAIANQIKKGGVVEVFGRISYNKYQDKYYTNITCNRVIVDGGDDHDQRPREERSAA